MRREGASLDLSISREKDVYSHCKICPEGLEGGAPVLRFLGARTRSFVVVGATVFIADLLERLARFFALLLRCWVTF